MALAAAAPNWPSNKITRKQDGSINVSWKNAGLTDETLEEFVDTRLDVLLQYLLESDGDPIECVVDMSGNSLRRPKPIKMLLQKLRSAPVHVVDLRLHKNQLTDVVAAVLAEHIHEAARAGRPLMQLHLSGNSFSSAGIWTLVEAVHTSGGYPRKGVNDRWALWLRAEHQSPPVLDAEEFLEQCQAAGQPVCITEKPPKDAVVQMHFGFTMPCWDGKGDLKTKGGKGEPTSKWVPVGKGEPKSKWVPVEKGADLEGTVVPEEKENGKSNADSAGKVDSAGKGKAGKGKADAVGQKESTDDWGSCTRKGCAPWKGGDWTGGSWKGKWKGDWNGVSDSSWMGDWDDGYYTHVSSKGQQQQHDDAVKGGPKGAGKQNDSSGADPASSGKASISFKTELCWFFGRGICAKGQQCTYAHGEKELRPPAAKGDSDLAEQQAPSVDQDIVKETMSWLKENRTKEGKEGTRFQDAWKMWCKEHNENDQVKGKRIQSMVEFKKRWEEGEMGRPHCEDDAELRETAPAESAELEMETQAALSAQAPSSLSVAMPSFIKASSSSSKMPQPFQATEEEEPEEAETGPKSESNEDAMVRLLGDKLFKKKTRKDAGGVTPHRGPSWESGPPVTSLK